MSLNSRNDRCSVPPMQSEISILNAEEYVGGPAYPPRQAQASQLVAMDVPGAAATGAHGALVEIQERPDRGENSKTKRLRGRPRLDTKDESAADRRRTQIRLAQRAYRHRKDTAITSLEQKVQGMKQVQKSMTAEFSKFYEIIVTEGILDSAPHAAPHLRSIADKLFQLSNISAISADDELAVSSEGDGSSSPPSGQSHQLGDLSDLGMSLSPGSQGSLKSYVAGSGMDTTSMLSSSESGHQQMNPLGYEVSMETGPGNASFPFLPPAHTAESNCLPDPEEPYPAQPLANPPLYDRLPPPTSYAFQERSFSRRLQRTTLERALTLANSPNPPPAKFASVFGYSLLFENKESLVNRLCTVLKRRQSEDLTTWPLPLKPVSTDKVAYIERQFGVSGLATQTGDFESTASTKFFGPPTPAALEEGAGRETQNSFRTFESEFLFPGDVEQFLTSLGIDIPASAEYVEASIDLDDLQERGSLYRPEDPQSDGPNPGLGSFNPWAGLSSLPGSGGGSSPSPGAWRTNPGHVLNAHGDSGSGVAGGIAALATQENYDGMWPQAPGRNKTKVTIDIAKLIFETSTRSICLGRSPGVRQRDVVKAVKIAAGLVPGGS